MFSRTRYLETKMNSFSRANKHRTTHLGTLKPDMERDSGFSDASSEYLSTVDLTDSEDVGRNGSTVGLNPSGPQVSVMGGSYSGLSPMIIMNNFVLKQPSQIAEPEKQWGFPSSLEMMPQSQVVLLQPMLSNASSSPPKTYSENIQQSKSFVPPLKSYPRIAPHPAEVASKRVGSHRVKGSSASGYEQRQRRHQHSHRLYSSPSPQPALQPPVKALTSFDAASNQPHGTEEQLSDRSLSSLAATSSLLNLTDEFSSNMDSSSVHDGCQDALSVDSNKLKRFSNTYNILNKSGLLGITLRTKQLIKENKRTQGQLQQLQEQTGLLLEALSSGDPQLWTKLQLSLQDTDKEQCGAKAQRILA
ncbi:CLOCK-interacting pacemaker a [Betta splendens]|uniref:CLOCK-interacting pacemaker a n=1 Tax=Betta splendens TaxID=158456 RepID=A0A6P7LKG4_BETSP|nr:CLOCK-interacting pacemaker a [Betta splendens]